VKLGLETNLRLWIALAAVGAFAVAAVITTRHLWWPERAIADHVASSAALRKQIEDSVPNSSTTDLRYSQDLFSPTPMSGYPGAEQPQSSSGSPYSYYPIADYYAGSTKPTVHQNNSLPALALPGIKDTIGADSLPAFQSLPTATSQDFKLPIQLLLPSPTGGLVSTGDILPVTPTIGGVQGVPAAPVTGPLSGAGR